MKPLKKLESYRLLVISSLIMFGIPTAGLYAASCAIPNVGKYWGSEQEICSRFWLVAAVFSATYMTTGIIKGFARKKEYEDVRKEPVFHDLMDLLYNGLLVWFGFSVVLAVCPKDLDAATAVLQQWWPNPVWTLKILITLVAGFVMVCDYRIWNFIKEFEKKEFEKKEKEKGTGNEGDSNRDEKLTRLVALRRDWDRTLYLIDVPTFCALLVTLVLVGYYWMAFPLGFCPRQSGSPDAVNSSFLLGLSSGAIAVEIWFANALYFLWIRRRGTEEPQIPAVPEPEVPPTDGHDR